MTKEIKAIHKIATIVWTFHLSEETLVEDDSFAENNVDVDEMYFFTMAELKGFDEYFLSFVHKIRNIYDIQEENSV
jgi:hypothetical protein